MQRLNLYLLYSGASLLSPNQSSPFANMNPSVPGDSGAWVFDKTTGQVCGHVLAWSERSRTAYIAPMQILLDDIARTLEATSVTLPDSEESFAWLTSPPDESQPVEAQASQQATEQLPLDLETLTLNRDEPLRNRASNSNVRDLKDVSSTYRGVSLMRQTRTLERQLA